MANEQNIRRHAIVVAGGSGSRFGSTMPKQFCLLGGVPVLMRTLDRFAAAGASLTLVLPHDHFPLWRDLCREHCYRVPHRVVAGGRTRYESVAAGLKAISPDPSDLVAVHDGVRPLVSAALIERAFATAAERGSAIPAIAVSDTIRAVDDNGSHQLARDSLRAVQTPQVFRAELLVGAYDEGFSPLFTDDASVVEHHGATVSLIEGETTNIKITHPIDMVIAEQILAQQ